MTSRWRLLVLPLLAMLLLAAESTEEHPAGQLVDRVVALVENRPITASQVALERAIRDRISGSNQREDFGRLLNEPTPPLEALIFREILRVQPQLGDLEADADRARDRLRLFDRCFKDRSEAARFRRAWGLENSDLVEYFAESVRLDDLIELVVNFRVTQEEEVAYYELNKERMFAGKPFEEVATYVAEQVFQLKFESEYNTWRSRLRASVRKRYIGR